MRVSSEDERVREEERKREEDRRINEKIDRWAKEFEEEFEREAREEEHQVAEQAPATEAPEEVSAGTVVEDLVEIVESVPSGVSEKMLEASRMLEVKVKQTNQVPGASQQAKRKRLVEKTPMEKAASSKKKGKKPMTKEDDCWIDDSMVNVTAAKRYEYIGYKDFKQEQGFQPRDKEAFIKEKLKHHNWTYLATLEEPARP